MEYEYIRYVIMSYVYMYVYIVGLILLEYIIYKYTSDIG